MSSLEQSYVRGSTSTPLIEDTISHFFDQAAERWADRDALISRHENIRWTYGDLQRQIDAFAAGLLALGLTKGDRVGIWSHNNAEWVVTQFATAKAGLILVNINPAYRRAELVYALNKVGCKVLITMPEFKTSNYIEMLQDVAPELNTCRPGALQAAQLPDLRVVIRLGTDKTPGLYNFSDITALPDASHHEQLRKVASELDPNDAINIQFTSGTTGNPKGATLTHRNVLNNGFFIGEAMKLTDQDRLCIPVPLYHCFGMVLGNLACVTHGSAIVYPAEAFEPEAVLKAVQAEKCTGLHGVPTMFIAELNDPNLGDYDLSSLRTGIMAGSPCPIEVMKRVISEMHMNQVTICYGMTETSPVSFQSSTDEPLEKRVSTVGRIHPHLEVKIVDSDGNIVPPGMPGELCTRGYSVMQGYWGDAEKTHEAIDDEGWMHTGDLATLDSEGYCNIVGRIKDMVIRGGENLYPREIEEYLYRHPAIQDVQVVGVPDKKYGEELCAWIIPTEGAQLSEDDVREFCKGQIAHYKIPRYIRFVREFPMTITGKVQKYLIREAMVSELGLKVDATA
ncbi:MAG: AMP-binding protein [Gammaproteobacteria bacterium]|nr:AMP-binding protein [Gammaproteobacteria bacterium]